MEGNAPLLEVRQVTKQFGSLRANDEIDLVLEAGEIHALLGENGAGKSTLMKILYGMYVPDAGAVLMDGQETVLHPPAMAKSHGIRMVFQNFKLIPALSVLENIALFAGGADKRLSRSALRSKVMDTAERYGITVQPDASVWQLDLGERQRVEILKALMSDDVRVVIFDEPTSVLTPQEVSGFLETLVRLRASGIGVLLITHKIPEVLACADKVTVLRNGRIVGRWENLAGVAGDDLVEAMMGGERHPAESGGGAATPLSERAVVRSGGDAGPGIAMTPGVGAAVLEVRDLTVLGDHQAVAVTRANMVIRAGTITGIAGVAGNGQRELIEALFGLRPARAGQILIEGTPLHKPSARQFLERGVHLISEDPLRESVVPGMTVLEHMVLGTVSLRRKGWSIDWQGTQSALGRAAVTGTLRLAAWDRLVQQLSGGNVQRVMLARALAHKPKVLLLSYPTRGLDIATVRAVHQLLFELRDAGCAIVFLSEDLGELFTVSSALYVLSHRRLFGPYAPHSTTPMAVGAVMINGEESA